MQAHKNPQVLQRGFRVDKVFDVKDNFSKDKAKVNVFFMVGKEYKKNILISNFTTEEDYYGEEIETLLGDLYEKPFGDLKIELRKKKKTPSIKLSKRDFFDLIFFTGHMWRRGDYQVDFHKSNSFNFDEEKIKEVVFSKRFLDKKMEIGSPFHKTIKLYDQVLIYNQSNIGFCLHNKHATVLVDRSNFELPDVMLEPLARDMMLVHILRKSYAGIMRNFTSFNKPVILEEKGVRLKTVIIKEDEVIKNIVSSYILYISSSEYYICDDTNIDLIESSVKDSNIVIKNRELFFKKYINKISK